MLFTWRSGSRLAAAARLCANCVLSDRQVLVAALMALTALGSALAQRVSKPYRLAYLQRPVRSLSTVFHRRGGRVVRPGGGAAFHYGMLPPMAKVAVGEQFAGANVVSNRWVSRNVLST